MVGLILILSLLATTIGGTATPPPREPPVHLRARYTMQHRIPWASWYFDSRPANSEAKDAAANSASTRFYSDFMISRLVDQAQQRIPQAEVYPKADGWLFEALDKFPVTRKTVLIVGSQVPFYEALALARGASSGPLRTSPRAPLCSFLQTSAVSSRLCISTIVKGLQSRWTARSTRSQ